MADNEIKILKTNTFEEWRQKSNEVSLNLGADDRLDSRLTDRVFKHDNVSGLKLNIIDGADDDNKSQVFQLIPDTTVDNTNGYIILTDGYSLPAAFVKGATVSQSGGYSAIIESVVTIDDKPKILVKNSSGDFNSGQNLTIGGASIPHANIVRIISESYNKASVRVLNGNTELVQGLQEADFHVPTISGKVTIVGSQDLSEFTEGTLIYQGTPNTPSTATTANIEANASWYATVYHAGTSHLYVKSHSGTYNNSMPIKVQGFTASQAQLTASSHNGFTTLDQTVGHAIEFNKILTANDDIKVIATDLVTAVNELQDDIGQVESLNTRYATKEVVDALNQVDTHLYDSGVTFAGLSANDFKAGVEELRTELGDVTTINNATGYTAVDASAGILEIQGDIGDIDDIQTTHSATLVGGINEIEEALRGTSLTNYNLDTDSTHGIVGGINELESALRGNNSNYTVSAGNNIRDGLNAVYDDIHTSGSVTISTDASHLVGGINELENVMRTASNAVSNYSLDTDAHNIVDAINELEGALRGTTGNYVTWGTGANISATDVRGAIVELGETIGSGVITGADTEAVGASNLTVAVNLLNTAIGDSDIYNTGTYGSATIAGTLDNLKTGVVNNDTDIGNLQKQIDGATTVDTARSWTGLAATHISGAIQELANTTLTAGNGLTAASGGNLQANRSFAVGATSGGGITVATNGIGVDSTVVRTNTANQTVNTNLTFTSGNTLSIPSGATLDIDGALQIGGSGGGSLVYATSFITIAGDNPQTGLEIDRSEIDTATVSTTLDAKIQWNEGVVGTKPDRAWQWVGIDESGNALNADLVSFYNAKDLIADTTEIDHTWDSSTQSFSSALKTTGVTAQQYGSTTAIPVLTIDSKGRITAAETANIVTELTFSGESNSGGSGEQKINLATETLHFDGVANQIVTEAKNNEIEIGLPTTMVAPGTLRVDSDTQSTSTTTGALRVDGGVGIGKDVFIGGNLYVSGATTQVDSNQVNIGDNIIVLNSDETGTPSQNGGIEIERGSQANKQLLWNEVNDRWEADGVAIITENTDYDTWRLAAEGVSSYEAISNSETVTFNQADGLTVTRSGSTIEYGHADTSTLLGQQGTASGGNVVQAITVDTFGHVTGVDVANLDNRFVRSWTFKEGNGEETGTISQGQTLHFEQGTGIEVEKTADRQLTFKNTDKGSDQLFFRNFTVTDTNLGYTWSETGTAAAEANEDTLTFVSGGAIDIDVDATSDAILINHADTSSYNSTPSISGGAATGTGLIGFDVNVDTYGHVTSVSGTTYDFDNRYLELTGGTMTGNITFSDDEEGIVWSRNTDGAHIKFHNTSDQDTDSYLEFSTQDNGNEYFKFNTVSGSNTYTLADLKLNGTVGDLSVYHIKASAINAKTDATLSIIGKSGGNTSGNPGKAVQIQGGAGTTHTTGAAGGNLNLYAGDGGQYSGTGGSVNIHSGGGGGSGGYASKVTLTGATSTGIGGDATIEAGLAAGSNKAGGDVYIKAGRGTGTGDPGRVIIQTSPKVGSGNSNQSLANEVVIDENGITTGEWKATVIADEYGGTGQSTYAKGDILYASGANVLTKLPAGTNGHYLKLVSGVPTWAADRFEANSNTVTRLKATGGSFTSGDITIAASGAASVSQNGTTITVSATDTNTTYSAATSSALGLIKIGYSENGKNYPVELSSGKAYVNVPWTDNNTTYSEATSSALGLVKIGYSENGKNYPVELSSGKMYVNVPWTDTDTNTTYSAGDGLDINGTTFSVEGNQTGHIHSVGMTGTANTSMTFGSGYASLRNSATSSAAGTETIRFGAGGQIDADGDIVAFSSAVGSDIKLKDNVQVVDGALEKVSQLEGVTFEWKKDGRESAGVIAQNVEEVFPRAVKEVESMGDNEGETHKVVDYNQLSALFVEAIKELKEENKLLRAEIEALKDINR